MNIFTTLFGTFTMQDHNFKVKIADLLQDSTHTDTIQFNNKFSTLLPQSQEGINATIYFHGADDRTIFFTVLEAEVRYIKDCDRCGKPVNKELYIEDVDGKGYVDMVEDEDDGMTINIDSKDGVIDMEDFLVHSLILTDDISTLCEECQKIADKEDEENIEETINTTTIKWL